MNKTLGVSLIVILAVAVIAGVYFMFGSQNSTQQTQQTSEAAQSSTVSAGASSSSANVSARTITIDASRWQFSPNVIQVKQGEHVKIVVNNQDTTHGISIPEYGVQSLDSVEFTADKAGTFAFHCPTFCGEGHREMTGTIVVSA